MVSLPDGPSERRPRSARLNRGWPWQTLLAVVLGLLVVGGQPAAASYAIGGAVGNAGRTVSMSHSSVLAVPGNPPHTVANGTSVNVGIGAALDGRPDFQVAFVRIDDVHAGQPFSYTLQVRNAGLVGGPVTVTSVLPPEFANVRVTAPGFVCMRRFAASGAQIGTLVTCSRNDLESGGVADLTIEANAPAIPGMLHLTAMASARDDAPEADVTNNVAEVTVQVHG